MTQSTAPAGWYQDPTAPQHLRYWDGAAWTSHVSPPPGGAPAVAFAAPPARRTGLSGAMIALVAVGVGVLLLAVLAAIAIPVFLTQQNRSADAAAQASAAGLGVEIATLFVEDPHSGQVTAFEDTDGTVHLQTTLGWESTVALPDGVRLGGLVGNSAEGFCVFVLSQSGSGFQYDSSSGSGAGTCGEGDDLP